MKSFIGYKSCLYKPCMSEARLLLPAGISLRSCSSQWVQDPPPISYHTAVISIQSLRLPESIPFTAGNRILCYLHKLFPLFCCAVFRPLQHLSLPASSVPTSGTPQQVHTHPSTTAAHIQTKPSC